MFGHRRSDLPVRLKPVLQGLGRAQVRDHPGQHVPGLPRQGTGPARRGCLAWAGPPPGLTGSAPLGGPQRLLRRLHRRGVRLRHGGQVPGLLHGRGHVRGGVQRGGRLRHVEEARPLP